LRIFSQTFITDFSITKLMFNNAKKVLNPLTYPPKLKP